MNDTGATRQAIDAIWRFESPRLIASLARLVRDVGQAEKLAQDAFLVALEQWRASGIPERPGAWLMMKLGRVDEARPEFARAAAAVRSS